MEKKIYRSFYFGDSLNSYERECGYLSYKNLFFADENLLLCNNIANDYENLELYSGTDYDDEYDCYNDIYQYYLIDESTANRLAEFTNEIIYYHTKLDLYVLGVTHFGTAWSHVLTNIKLEEEENGTYTAFIEV